MRDLPLRFLHMKLRMVFKTQACVGYAYTMDNKHKKRKSWTVFEKWLIVPKLERVALRRTWMLLGKKASKVEDSSRLELNEQTLAATQLEDQVKCLREQANKLEDKAVINVTFYDDLCFDVFYHAWSSNGGARSFN
uniref:Uncharacterized protein n=1 Tax=Cannabis sativa TaxID=3483 RepID=A0A803PPT4_CANSA